MLEACYIRVEVKKRELISRIDLAIEILRHGIPVIIGEVYSAKELERIGIDKGYIFGKCAQLDTLKKFKPLIDKGWAMGALDEEGLFPVNLERFAKHRFSIESSNIFKEVFFFGQTQKDVFEDHYGPKDSFITSGNPRTDMWQSNCFGIHYKTEKIIKNNYGDFILLPLNFSSYTNTDRNAVTHSNHLKYKKSLAKNSEFLFDSFCKLAQRLAQELDINVVMRPHPADNPKTIRNLMDHHGVSSERVICNSSFEVFPWISSSRLVIHNCCTTSLEAGFLGTPVVTYAPADTFLLQDDIDGLHDYLNKLFPILQNPEEVIGYLSSATYQDRSYFQKKIHNWGRLNLDHSGNISCFIAKKIFERHSFMPNIKKLQLKRQFEYKRIRNEFIAKIASLSGNNQRQVILDKFPKTEVSEVKDIVRSICLHRGYQNLPRVQQINSKLFAMLPGK